MITIVIVSLLAALVYLLWKGETQPKPWNKGSSSPKVTIWLLIGILSLVALLDPKIRNRIKDLKKNYRL